MRRAAASAALVCTLAALAVSTRLSSRVHASAAAAQAEPSRIPMIEAADRDALLAHVGQLVIVVGTIESAEWSGKGRVMNVEFAGAREARGAMAVVFANQRGRFDEAFLGDFAATVKGRRVRVDGRLQEYGGYAEEYKGRPQIVLNSTEQITIVPRDGERLPTTRATTRGTTRPATDAGRV